MDSPKKKLIALGSISAVLALGLIACDSRYWGTVPFESVKGKARVD